MITDLLYFHKSIVKFRINRLQVCDYQAFAQYLLVKDQIEAGVYKMAMKESLQKSRRTATIVTNRTYKLRVLITMAITRPMNLK